MGMARFDEHLLEQEVQELTGMLRADPAWENLRQALTVKGFAAAEVLLAGFMEDEEGGEYGAIVTKSGEVYEYERDTRPNALIDFKRFNRVEDVGKLIRDMYPAVEVALRRVARSA